MATSGIETTILLACRNEAPSILSCLKRVRRACPASMIIIIDGGSDETEQLVAEHYGNDSFIRYIKNTNDRGKGHAIQVGLEHTETEFVAQIDADLQFLPEDLPALFARLQSDEADMVLGSRFLQTSTRLPGSTPLLRTVGNRLISMYVSLLVGCKVTDALAGMKAWRTCITEARPLRCMSYSYEAELIISASMGGYRIQDEAITTVARQFGESSVRVVQAGARILRDVSLLRLGYGVPS